MNFLKKYWGFFALGIALILYNKYTAANTPGEMRTLEGGGVLPPAPAQAAVSDAPAWQAELDKQTAPVKAALAANIASITQGASRPQAQAEISFLTMTLENIKKAFMAGKVGA